MQMEETRFGNILVLSVRQGRIDTHTGADLKKSIADIVGRGDRRLVVDLSHVSFIDSTGLGAIVSSLKVVGRDGDLVVCGLNEAVATLFKLTRMDKVFRAYAGPAEAVAALNRAA